MRAANFCRRIALQIWLFPLFTFSCGVAAEAPSTAVPSAPATATETTVSGSMLLVTMVQVLFALGVVLALVWGLGWVLRRVAPGGGGSSSHWVRAVGGTYVGPKERVVVVEVNGVCLVLGVTAQQITLLHSFPKSDLPVAAEQPAAVSAFAEKLKQVWQSKPR